MCTSRNKVAASGLTLLEVVIALTLLGLITGTLFAVIQGSVRTASQMDQLQRENDNLDRLLELCRQAFASLPSTATLKLTLLDPNAPDTSLQELEIANAPSAFVAGLAPRSSGDNTLSLRPDPDGQTDGNQSRLNTLCLSREDLNPSARPGELAQPQATSGPKAADDQGRYWMPLLPNVVEMRWHFYRESERVWYQEWSRSNWPELIELQLRMADRSLPLRMVFSLPTLQITKGTGSPSGSSANSPAGNASTQNNANPPPGQGSTGGPSGNRSGGGPGGRPPPDGGPGGRPPQGPPPRAGGRDGPETSTPGTRSSPGAPR
jgi:type II secretory pathway pseudopilin PulG